MAVESFFQNIGTSETLLYQMPAYVKGEAGEFEIQPRSGSARISFNNSSASSISVTLKLKTVFDLEAKTVGKVTVPAGSTRYAPLSVNLRPGDYIAAEAETVDSVTALGRVFSTVLNPVTDSGEVIWSPFSMRRPIDHTVAWAIASRTYGAAAAGGFFAGVIDTVRGTIESADAYQTGERFAVLVSPKDLEATGVAYNSAGTGFPFEPDAKTRWNGLAGSDAIIAKNLSENEVHNHVASVRSNNPPPTTEQGSDWYVPALDELEVMYRNLKPSEATNSTATQEDKGYGFPTIIDTHGTNISSDPIGSGYSNNPLDPDVTPLDQFKEGGSQSLDLGRYWTTTNADPGSDERGRGWLQVFTFSDDEAIQFIFYKTSSNSVRPIRRVNF